jgi:hypothetical protein
MRRDGARAALARSGRRVNCGASVRVKQTSRASDSGRKGGKLVRRLLASALFVTAITSAGCVVGTNPALHRGYGPPPHAPAHGYRHHYQGADLAFDRELGVYVVLGHPGIYYANGRFLRFRTHVWQSATRLDGTWVVYPTTSIPPGLRGSHPGKADRAGKKGHNAHPPAKGHW